MACKLSRDHEGKKKASVDINWQQHLSAKAFEVKKLIEKCIEIYMNKKETIVHLLIYHGVEPVETEAVWDEIQEQNPHFFAAYTYMRQVTVMIKRCNALLQSQWLAMQNHPHFSKGMELVGTNGMQTSEANNPFPENQNSYAATNIDLDMNDNLLTYGTETNSTNGANSMQPCGTSNPFLEDHDFYATTNDNLLVNGMELVGANCPQSCSYAPANGNQSFHQVNNGYVPQVLGGPSGIIDLGILQDDASKWSMNYMQQEMNGGVGHHEMSDMHFEVNNGITTGHNGVDGWMNDLVNVMNGTHNEMNDTSGGPGGGPGGANERMDGMEHRIEDGIMSNETSSTMNDGMDISTDSRMHSMLQKIEQFLMNDMSPEMEYSGAVSMFENSPCKAPCI